MQAVFIRHENAEVIGQFGQVLPDDSFVLENGAGGRLQWLAENEQADDETGKPGSHSPGESRQPAFANFLLRRGPAQLPAHLRRKIFPIIFRPLRQRNAFQSGIEIKIVHHAPPAVVSQRFSFRRAANTRHETVVSEQPKTCAASAWFKPSELVSTMAARCLAGSFSKAD